MEPSETLYLIESDKSYGAAVIKNIVMKDENIDFEFEISAAYYQTPDNIEYVDTTTQLKDFFQWRPEFAGYIYYKTLIKKQEMSCVLNLGTAYEAVEVFVNNKSAGARIGSPYHYDLTGMLNLEQNEVVIKIATNLVYAQCDRFSKNVIIPPMGLIGPVTIAKMP